MRFMGEAVFFRLIEEPSDPLMSQRSFLVTGAFDGIDRAPSDCLPDTIHLVAGTASDIDDTRSLGSLVSVDQGAPWHSVIMDLALSCLAGPARRVLYLLESCRDVVIRLA
jgi:hypothetical protein